MIFMTRFPVPDGKGAFAGYYFVTRFFNCRERCVMVLVIELYFCLADRKI